MQQLTQKLKSGEMKILEVPMPFVHVGQILVRNHYSLISAGTEGSTVKTARKGLIGKAKERPKQVKQVVDTLMSQGPVQTYRAVMKKLDAHSPLGYSTAGEVIAVGEGARSFRAGDLVACGGLSAAHAEIVAVPQNLCVKLPENADLKQAAYNTLGAIAMQGVRQADLRLGECCAVIGLGLLGQLTALLLKASGVQVVGIDIDPTMVEIGKKNCLNLGLVRKDNGIEDKVARFTDGLGCDAVIITAGTSSLDPINFAGAISREKGTVVVVGAVPTGFDREPHYYKKELQLKMSCSYGPGRYDPIYEEKGIDYPAAYVRWSENRNMQAFQNLLHSGNIDISYLTTHLFKLEEATNAYDLMMEKSEPFIGILIEYDISKKLIKTPARIFLKSVPIKVGASGSHIGFIGAGSYAQSHLLPNIPKNKDVVLKGVMAGTGTGSRSAGERFGFEFCTSDEKEILENEEINTIFVATPHDSHADHGVKALKAGKHLFVEKPLCLNENELNDIADIYNAPGSKGLLMVGYNRRFSPLARMIKRECGDGAMSMIYRINAGAIPPDSWIQDPDVGGGRIIGEVCHFVDFLTYINGSLPVSVYAAAMQSAGNLNDTLNITLRYRNGSIGTISYFANGDKGVPKERVEVFANGSTAILNDFKALTIFAHGKKKEKKLLTQDKGQPAEVKEFIDAIIKGAGAPIPFDEIYSTSFVTFKIVESLGTGMCVSI
jgi:polar amino acid transport system substrate-binding protein